MCSDLLASFAVIDAQCSCVSELEHQAETAENEKFALTAASQSDRAALGEALTRCMPNAHECDGLSGVLQGF